MPDDSVHVWRRVVNCFVLALCVWMGGAPAAASPREWPLTPSPISLSMQKLGPFFRQFGDDTNGKLRYLGGFRLSSDHGAFGGFSGLLFEPERSRLLAVSDAGGYLFADVEHDKGVISSLHSARLGALRDVQGRRLLDRGLRDAESLTQEGGALLIGFEGVNRPYRFERGPLGEPQRGVPVDVPDVVRRWPRNKGMEALASQAQHPLFGQVRLAIAERSGDKTGPLTEGYVLQGRTTGRFYIRRPGHYDITDAAFLPNGDLLLLERRVFLVSGLGIRLRQIPLSAMKVSEAVGDAWDGDVLMEANLSYPIDNMEGMSVTRVNGRTLLTLISDDNYMALQRTLLLQFELLP